MSDRYLLRGAGIAALAVVMVGCLGNPSSTDAEPPAPSAPAVDEAFPDPPPMVAEKVTAAVTEWVAEHADDAGVFDVPPRGGEDVAGTLSEFHAVHQQDADTYTVCVDFLDGDRTYDVDFFVDRTADGLTVRNAYLHKIDGRVVSG